MGNITSNSKNIECKMNKKEQIEKHVQAILSLIGEDPNREGLIGTPERIARMFDEIFRGCDAAQKPKII